MDYIYLKERMGMRRNRLCVDFVSVAQNRRIINFEHDENFIESGGSWYCLCEWRW